MQGRENLLLRHPLRPQWAVEERPVANEERRLALNQPGKPRRANCTPGERELKRDQQAEREQAFGERHGLAEQDGGERRAERHRHDEVERAELRERTLARHPQEEDEREVGQGADDEDAAEVAPGGKNIVTSPRRSWTPVGARACALCVAHCRRRQADPGLFRPHPALSGPR